MPRPAAGHTSACFNLGVYASAYLIWVWHWRHPLPSRRLSRREEFAADLLNVLAKTWMLVGAGAAVGLQSPPRHQWGLSMLPAGQALLPVSGHWRRVCPSHVHLSRAPLAACSKE